MEIDVVATRRNRLRLWIKDNFGGVPARFIDATGINQGELSGLLNTKSFREKKARKLETQAGMPDGWLDVNDDSAIGRLIYLYNGMNNEHKEMLMSLARNLHSIDNKKDKPDNSEIDITD